MRTLKRYGVLAGIVGFALLLAVDGWAHRVNIFCWVEGKEVVSESAFPSGTPVHEGTIRVFAEDADRKLLEGSTDTQGRFRFRIPKQAIDNAWDLRVEIDAGVGHVNSWLVRASEFATSGSSPKPTASQSQAAGTDRTDREVAASNAAELTPKELEAALERKLRPIHQKLSRLEQDRVSVQDVVGGLGYILGLAGIALYCSARRRG